MLQLTWYTVQYCPCGHALHRTEDEIIEDGGFNQLRRIERGEKLDAVIFPSGLCPICSHVHDYPEDYSDYDSFEGDYETQRNQDVYEDNYEEWDHLLDYYDDWENEKEIIPRQEECPEELQPKFWGMSPYRREGSSKWMVRRDNFHTYAQEKKSKNSKLQLKIRRQERRIKRSNQDCWLS
jgi:hypothetical protein